jgi:hypothetical protein
MTVNPLPPQAYTKETLQKAYTWLLSQPTSVKEMATSQDMLVSLYLKAQRSGDASLETPSIQNFKQELKNLANLIGDLQPAHAPKVTQAPTTSMNSDQLAKSTGSTQPSSLIKGLGAYQFDETQSLNNAPPSSSNGILGFLDAQSLSAIQEVRQNLNLGSDVEALRALISLGHRQIKKI